MAEKYTQKTRKQILEEYEKKIEQASAELFSLDKDMQRVDYKRGALKLTDLVVNYFYTVNQEYYMEFGLEMTETTQKCIENFSSEEGEFLRYLRVSIKMACKKAFAEAQDAQYRSGITGIEYDKKLLSKMRKFFLEKGISLTEYTDEYISLAAQELEVKEKRLREAIDNDRNSKVVFEFFSKNEDGEDVSIFDLIKSDESVDSRVLHREKCKDYLNRVEAVYNSCQDRQKPVVSDLLTVMLCKSELFDDVDLDIYIDLIDIDYRFYNFINVDIFKEYVLNHNLPKNLDIAKKHKVADQATSRTKKDLLKKLREAFKELYPRML